VEGFRFVGGSYMMTGIFIGILRFPGIFVAHVYGGASAAAAPVRGSLLAHRGINI
jgi:hypothetical protein